MRGFVLAVLVGTTAVLSPSSKAVAEQRLEQDAEYWIRERVHESASRAQTETAILKELSKYFRQSEFDGVVGISEQDHELRLHFHASRLRGEFMAQHWFQYDVNSDLVVTREEIQKVTRSKAFKDFTKRPPRVAPTEEQLSKIQREMTEELLGHFTAAPDPIKFEDAIAVADRVFKSEARERLTQRLVPLGLDRNGDKIVSRAEFDAAVKRIFRDIDQNRDGQIALEEMFESSAKQHELQRAKAKMAAKAKRAAKKQDGKEPPVQQPAGCSLPELALDQEFVFVSVGSGDVLTNILLDDREETARYKRLSIEPGSKKLVLGLRSSGAVIWDISGATDRVERIVIGSSGRSKKEPDSVKASGVIGVDAQKVTFLQKPTCLPYASSLEDAQEKELNGSLKQLMGRAPDGISINAGSGTLILPSMTLDKTQDFENLIPLPDNGGPGALMWARFKEKNSFGVIDVDPAVVVSNGTPDRQTILSGEAGLAQLLDQGAIEIHAYQVSYSIGNGTYTVGVKPGSAGPAYLPDTEVIWLPSQYRILKEIRIPADLCDISSPRFITANGVPAPQRGTCPS